MELNLLNIILFLETDKFNRHYSKNEKVCIDNEIYTIYDVIYGIDANIYIYIYISRI